MKRTVATSLSLTAVTISWSMLLFSQGPWAADAAALMAACLLALTAIAVAGMLVASSRWGRWLGVTISVVPPLLAMTVPVGPWWIANLVVSGAVLAALAGTATSGVIRRLPRADGPTPRVVAFILGLAGVPLLVAVVSPHGLGAPEWLIAGSSAAAAFAYAKAQPYSVLAVRALYLAVAVTAAVLAGWPRGALWALTGVVVTAFAWHRDIRLAVRPLSGRGRAVPILPELVPSDVLEAAGLDEHGRPKRSS